MQDSPAADGSATAKSGALKAKKKVGRKKILRRQCIRCGKKDDENWRGKYCNKCSKKIKRDSMPPQPKKEKKPRSILKPKIYKDESRKCTNCPRKSTSQYRLFGRDKSKPYCTACHKQITKKNSAVVEQNEIADPDDLPSIDQNQEPDRGEGGIDKIPVAPPLCFTVHATLPESSLHADSKQVTMFDENPPVSSRPDATLYPPGQSCRLDPPIFDVTKDNNWEINLVNRCHKEQILLIRGISEVTKFNKDKFSVESLVAASPETEIGIRVQRRQDRNTNVDGKGKTTWNLESMGLDENEKNPNLKYMRDHGDTSLNEKIRFGTDFAMDVNIFKDQFKEISKLPRIFRPNMKNDIMSFIDHLPGFHGVYALLKVTVVRTLTKRMVLYPPSILLAVREGQNGSLSLWNTWKKQIKLRIQGVSVSENLPMEYGQITKIWRIWEYHTIGSLKTQEMWSILDLGLFIGSKPQVRACTPRGTRASSALIYY